MVSYIVSGSNITMILNGRAYSVDSSHPNYEKIKAGLSSLTEEELVKLTDLPKAVENFCAGKAEVRDGEVVYEGKPLHNNLAQRILALMSDGFPFEPMLRFLENLMQNPSAQSISELYEFLSNRGLPITEDGHFLAYKVVRADYLDKYSGTIDNHPGKVIEFKRREVDDRREHTCSFGLAI